jgi:hypothetical protein
LIQQNNETDRDLLLWIKGLIFNLHHLRMLSFLLIFIRCKEDEIYTAVHDAPQTPCKIQPSLVLFEKHNTSTSTHRYAHTDIQLYKHRR